MEQLKNYFFLLFLLVSFGCEGARDKQDSDTFEFYEEETTLGDFEYEEIDGVFEDDEDALDFAEVDPQFPGGEQAMNQYIADRVIYPSEAIENAEQGIVYVEFIVNKNGSIQNVKTVRGVSKSLDQEAVRVIKGMPRWEPGIQNGEEVRVRFTIPIHFRLE